MFTQCRNCAGPLTFDPTKQKLVCGHCGSEFAPEEFTQSEKEYLLDKQAEAAENVYGDDAKDMMDCYVYQCHSCGGEIIINGTEASTRCIYCGNSNVVFSRIARHKRPQLIIPFKLTKEEAVAEVRKRFKKGMFIPREIKNFKVDNVRGIYIPYWIVDCDHKASVVIQGQVSSGKHTRTVFYGRAGRMSLKRLPLDASKMLSDESSARLEPYNLGAIKPFDEDYLLGFYSNISDITYGDLRSAANMRASEYFNQYAIADVKGASGKKVCQQAHVTAINYDNLNYAMFPAWFVTYYYKGQHNTILVNGQSGKIVCGVPWNKVLFYTLLIIAGIVLTAATFIIMRPMLEAIFSSSGSSSSSSSDSRWKILVAIVAGAIAMFSWGITKIRKVIKSINLTQDNAIFNFAKKRQE